MNYDSEGGTKQFDIKASVNVERFILSMEKPTIAKIMRSIELLEKFVYKLGPPHSKKI